MEWGKIQVMDCTLRDGGYLNDWKFGKETIYGVTREVPKTGVDIFELCFMRDQPFSEDRCVFSSVESMAGILNKVPGVKYAAMIETDVCFQSRCFRSADRTQSI